MNELDHDISQEEADELAELDERASILAADADVAVAAARQARGELERALKRLCRRYGAAGPRTVDYISRKLIAARAT